MVRSFGQPVPLETPQAPEPAPKPVEPQAPQTIILPRSHPSRFGLVVLLVAGVMALLWISVGAAYLWGWLGPQGLMTLDPARKALASAAVFLPAFLFMAVAAVLARSVAMSDATRVLLQTSERLFAADEIAAGSAARLARVVRRELDGLNTGLDVAFQRMRTLEAILEKQISTLDDAGARAQVRSETIAVRLNQEMRASRPRGRPDRRRRPRRRNGGGAVRAAQGHHGIAEGTLKMATQSLEVQVAGFRLRHHRRRRSAVGSRQGAGNPKPRGSRKSPTMPSAAPNSCWRAMKSIAARWSSWCSGCRTKARISRPFFPSSAVSWNRPLRGWAGRLKNSKPSPVMPNATWTC
jgi:hypothetical protein